MFIVTTVLLLVIIAYFAIISAAQERKHRSERGNITTAPQAGDTQPNLQAGEKHSDGADK